MYVDKCVKHFLQLQISLVTARGFHMETFCEEFWWITELFFFFLKAFLYRKLKEMYVKGWCSLNLLVFFTVIIHWFCYHHHNFIYGASKEENQKSPRWHQHFVFWWALWVIGLSVSACWRLRQWRPWSWLKVGAIRRLLNSLWQAGVQQAPRRLLLQRGGGAIAT